jgi:hypothetical protein
MPILRQPQTALEQDLGYALVGFDLSLQQIEAPPVETGGQELVPVDLGLPRGQLVCHHEIGLEKRDDRPPHRGGLESDSGALAPGDGRLPIRHLGSQVGGDEMTELLLFSEEELELEKIAEGEDIGPELVEVVGGDEGDLG